MNSLEIPGDAAAPGPSERWRLRHSLWMGWLLTLGFGSFIGFLWIGGRTRRASWLLAGVAYSILPVLFFASGRDSTLHEVAALGRRERGLPGVLLLVSMSMGCGKALRVSRSPTGGQG
jgi:hypothetical protein